VRVWDADKCSGGQRPAKGEQVGDLPALDVDHPYSFAASHRTAGLPAGTTTRDVALFTP